MPWNLFCPFEAHFSSSDLCISRENYFLRYFCFLYKVFYSAKTCAKYCVSTVYRTVYIPLYSPLHRAIVLVYLGI